MSQIWTLEDILQATSGRLVYGTGPSCANDICTDTRSLKSKDVFVALQGEHYDGHDFIGKAIESGSSILIVSEEYLKKQIDFLDVADVHVVAVSDTLMAYGDLARWHRHRLDIPVIAVTGSVGKSSTRRLIASVLKEDFPICETLKNENNVIGVPKTILGAQEHHRAIVVELGIDRPGEMDQLLHASQPQVGVMVGITYVHLDRLGSLEGVAREKAKLLDAVRPTGWAILNVDTPLCSYFAGRCGKVLTYGLEQHASVSGIVTRYNENGCAQGEIIARGKGYPVSLQSPGRHQFKNALAAWAVGELFEISPQKRQTALQNYTGMAGRFSIKKTAGGARIIDDTYNANPASFSAALETLQGLPAIRRIIVAGDMFELGDISEKLHYELGKSIGQAGIDCLFAVGARSKRTADGALSAGMQTAAVHLCKNTQEAVDALLPLLNAGDVVLVKGSRGMTMEKVVEGLIPETAKEAQN